MLQGALLVGGFRCIRGMFSFIVRLRPGLPAAPFARFQVSCPAPCQSNLMLPATFSFIALIRVSRLWSSFARMSVFFARRLERRKTMDSFLFAVAAFVLGLLITGLICVLKAPTLADRMMSAQLLGTSGIAALLLIATAVGEPAIVDVALALALLAAFASIAFVTSSGDRQ